MTMRWLLLALLSCVWTTGPSSKPAAKQRPNASARAWKSQATNVLVLVLDDVGTNAIRAYKEVEDLPRTPNIDGLARDGVLFRNGYSYPVCSAARAALLTGRYGRRTGIGDAISDSSSVQLALSEVTIPEMLPSSWSSAALGKWHLTGQQAHGWQRHPLAQGFETHRGSPSNLGHYGSGDSYTDFEKLVDGQLGRGTTYATSDTVNDAVRVIAKMPEPWFTWVAFNAPHEPFHVPPERLLKERLPESATIQEKFRAAIEAMDHEIGRLLRTMDPEVRERTMVVVIGDNGTPPQGMPKPFSGREAKFTLYEGGTNVAFIVSGAGVAAKGTESRALVHAVDLFPTVARVAGVKSSEVRRGGKPVQLDGHALQPLLANPAADWPRKELYTERLVPPGNGPYSEEHVAVRNRRYKWMEVRKGGEVERYLFDLKGKVTDGENLLDGPLSDQAKQARDRLKEALAGYERLRPEN